MSTHGRLRFIHAPAFALATGLSLTSCGFGNTVPVNVSASAGAPLAGAVPDIQNTFSAASILDHTRGEWIVFGYQDQRGQPLGPGGLASSAHSMGMAILDGYGTWRSYPQLGSGDPAGVGSRDGGWVASPPQGGAVAYYLGAGERNPGDGNPTGLYVTLVNAYDSVTTATSATPHIAIRGPIAVGGYGDAPFPSASTQWYEPTVAATQPAVPGPGTVVLDRVIVAACDVNDRPSLSQQSLFVWVSDGGWSYRPAAQGRVFAPGMTEATSRPGPGDTIIRPVLHQDPRAGHACEEYLAYGVRAPSQLPGFACSPPNAQCERLTGIAETMSNDCGEHWSRPKFIVGLTGGGTVPGTGGRNFSYAIGDDGARYLAWVQTSAVGDALQILSAAPGQDFAFTTGSGVVAAAAAGTARARPTVAAARGGVVITYHELAAGVLRMGAAVGSAALTGWSTHVLAPGGSPACPTSDTELGAYDALIAPRALLNGFRAVWTQSPSPACSGTHFNAFSSELAP